MGKRGEMSTGWDLSTKMMGAIRDAIGDIPAKCFFDIETASFEKDTTQATDLVLKLSGGDMAVRSITPIKATFFHLLLIGLSALFAMGEKQKYTSYARGLRAGILSRLPTRMKPDCLIIVSLTWIRFGSQTFLMIQRGGLYIRTATVHRAVINPCAK
jgi:hypothetical protein